ncbi:MAG: M12 family metallopeptidase [Verrucomicrobiota bacterium]
MPYPFKHIPYEVMTAQELLEKIKADAPQVEIDGESYYVVESDLTVSDEQLLGYCEYMATTTDPEQEGPPMSESLVVATVDGRMMRWEDPTVLTWSIDEASFEGQPDSWLETTKVICKQGAGDWNDAAREQGVIDKISFAEAEAGSMPAFRFAFHPFAGRPGLLALAFFPHDLPAKRTIFLGPGTFHENLAFDRRGIIRHELGHVLGFRHEHIRPEAHEGMSQTQKEQMEKVVTSGMGGENLTIFDGSSVMHYPINGHGSMDFQLTDLDKAGFGKIYSMPADSDKIREFPV